MPRIPAIQNREQVAPEGQAAFDSIVASRGRVGGPFAVLMHSPEIAGRTAHLGAYIRFESKLDHKLEETVVLAACRELNCAFEWGAHSGGAKQAGVSDETIAAIRDRKHEALSADDRQLVDYTQHLIRDHTIDAAAVKAIEQRLGTEGLVELTATIGYYSLLAVVLNAFDVEPLPGADVLPK